MFMPQRVLARDWLKGRADPAQAVTWQPHAVTISCDGNAGATTGAWQRGPAFGYFTTVWRRDPRKGEMRWVLRSEEHTSELQSLMRISYAVFCLKKKKKDANEYQKF